MKREIIVTADGSSTLFVEELDENYHSVNGAITESMHVFIERGLRQCKQPELAILEIGFGTGLNCVLSFKELPAAVEKVYYDSIELYPVTNEEFEQLNYADFLDVDIRDIYRDMFLADWDETVAITDNFYLRKIHANLLDAEFEQKYDLVYFDAFAPNKQPELWTIDVFQKMYDCMKKGAWLTTYCAKGEVRRNMQSVGFTVTRTDGPPCKREMLIAQKE